MRSLIAVAFMLAAAAASAQTAPPQPDVIVTTGEAVVRRAPDRAFITVIVETRAKNPRDAQRLNAEAMTAVHDAIERGPIDDEVFDDRKGSSAEWLDRNGRAVLKLPHVKLAGRCWM